MKLIAQNVNTEEGICCWESVIPNLWYSDYFECAFMLTPSGFVISEKARSKSEYLLWKTF